MVLDSRSLQHSAVGWLHAIERRGKACEFSWEAQVNGYDASQGRIGVPRPKEEREAKLLQRWAGAEDAQMFPEKQHIVPFSIARRIVNKGGTRATASPSNAIGNLTWLSRRQNALDALSDRWAVMDEDRDLPNLLARGMLVDSKGEGPAKTVVKVYKELQAEIVDGADAAWKDEATLRHRREQFECFHTSRAAWMVEEMKGWLDEPLSPEANEWLAESAASAAK